jgi:hypothetical protein
MSEWYDNQQQPSSNLRKLIQERIEKANPRRNLTAVEAKRLAKLEAIADAEEMYEDIKYMKRRGKKIYSISIKQAVAMYIEDKAKYVGIDGANGIVEGRLGTIKAHMKHFLEYVHKDA